QFTLLTGIGGGAWVNAAKAAGKALGLPIRAITIGPRADFEDHVGDWHKLREIGDSGCLLIRPDQHVAWRSGTASSTAEADLSRALRSILGH
nr:2,4-dichlorophenol 6-monooxygenase [Paracoccaceae bacterium]